MSSAKPLYLDRHCLYNAQSSTVLIDNRYFRYEALNQHESNVNTYHLRHTMILYDLICIDIVWLICHHSYHPRSTVNSRNHCSLHAHAHARAHAHAHAHGTRTRAEKRTVTEHAERLLIQLMIEFCYSAPHYEELNSSTPSLIRFAPNSGQGISPMEWSLGRIRQNTCHTPLQFAVRTTQLEPQPIWIALHAAVPELGKKPRRTKTMYSGLTYSLTHIHSL
jgi:hypothetical protein